MIIERKIELLTAYEQGKTVEVYYQPDGKWHKINHDIWDFENSLYRIKPAIDAKFKVGDTLVFRTAAEEPNPPRYKITEITEDSYKFDCLSPRPIEGVDITYINIKDVLWYFEIYDYASKTYFLAPTRRTMEQMDKEYASNHDTHKWLPVYHLGFKLKEN